MSSLIGKDDEDRIHEIIESGLTVSREDAALMLNEIKLLRDRLQQCRINTRRTIGFDLAGHGLGIRWNETEAAKVAEHGPLAVIAYAQTVIGVHLTRLPDPETPTEGTEGDA